MWWVFSLTSEKEAERIRERLAQAEAEAMEMEDEEIKTEHMLEKGASIEMDYVGKCMLFLIKEGHFKCFKIKH